MSQLRFLVVDDDVAVGVVLQGLLGQMGVAATVVHGSKEALDILDSSEYDCVITDLRMPGMDGATIRTGRYELRSGITKNGSSRCDDQVGADLAEKNRIRG